MSLLERARLASTPTHTLDGWPLRLRAAGTAVSAGLVSLLAVALPALLVWVSSPESTVAWTRAFGVGAHAWLLAHGVHLGVGAGTVSLVPLLLVVLPLWLATVAARRALSCVARERPRRFTGWFRLRRDVAEVALAFVGGYAVFGLVVALLARTSTLHASLAGTAVGTAAVALVAVVLACRLEFRAEWHEVAPGLADRLRHTVPANVRRALGPGMLAAAILAGAGAVLVVTVVALHADRVGRLYGALDAGLAGTVVLSLVELLALPNLALWGVAWMAGPGFGIAEGSAVTWSHSSPGLLPLVPVLGALPDPGPLPSWLALTVLVPVGAGMVAGWRSLGSVTRLASLRTKLTVACLACVVAALVLGAAAALGGGALGGGRLGHVGPDVLVMAAAVLGELGLGAVLTVLVGHWWATRR